MIMDEKTKNRIKMQLLGNDSPIMEIIQDLKNYHESERQKRLEIIDRIFKDLKFLLK